MKNFNKLLILSGVLLLASTLFGQTILTQTTLAAAVATQSTTAIRLTSATGVVATSTVLFVLEGQGEAMFVNSVVGTTAYVTRGYEGYGSASPHSSGAVVFVIPGVAMAGPTGALNAVPPDGSCTRSSIAYLPVISTGVAGAPVFISDCVGGVWVNGIASPPKLMNYQLQLPNIGSVAYSAAGTSTAKATNTMYCTEIDLPYNKNLTGLGMLNGAATGTDKWVLALYDSAGTPAGKQCHGWRGCIWQLDVPEAGVHGALLRRRACSVFCVRSGRFWNDRDNQPDSNRNAGLLLDEEIRESDVRHSGVHRCPDNVHHAVWRLLDPVLV